MKFKKIKPMKTIILTIIIPFSFLLLNAQKYEYIPLVNDTHLWSYCDIVKVGVDEYDLKYSQFNFEGDTIIHAITYKKLFQQDCNLNKSYYMASLREENKKIYAIYPEKQDEQKIYDFSLVVGDSIQSPYDINHYFKVTKVDTVEVGATKRKRIKLDFDTWVEGLGTLDRFLIFPLQGLALYDLGVRINYQKQGDEIIYTSNEWYFNINECNTSLIDHIQPNKSVAYFTTPELLKVETALTDSNYTFELLDLTGKLLVQNTLNAKDNVVNVGQLSNGLYIIRLSRNREVCFIAKIIKQN